MSQSKTLIQGLEAAESSNTSAMGSAPSGFYSNSNNSSNHRGTVVPGMQPAADNGNGEPQQKSSKSAQSGKPVVGFLYSISRTPFGEYWPLKIGPNTIGMNPDCDIVLSEGTVSGEHAVLVVRQIKNTGSVIAAIADEKSTNGTMINGETIGFSAEECKSGDIITIGNNYELVLILVDAAKMNLSVSQDFIPVQVDEEVNDEPWNDFSAGGFGKTRLQGSNTSSIGGGDYNHNSNGTVGLNGFDPGAQRGGTIPV